MLDNRGRHFRDIRDIRDIRDRARPIITLSL